MHRRLAIVAVACAAGGYAAAYVRPLPDKRTAYAVATCSIALLLSQQGGAHLTGLQLAMGLALTLIAVTLASRAATNLTLCTMSTVAAQRVPGNTPAALPSASTLSRSLRSQAAIADTAAGRYGAAAWCAFILAAATVTHTTAAAHNPAS
jgi:hypothetical protein